MGLSLFLSLRSRNLLHDLEHVHDARVGVEPPQRLHLSEIVHLLQASCVCVCVCVCAVCVCDQLCRTC